MSREENSKFPPEEVIANSPITNRSVVTETIIEFLQVSAALPSQVLGSKSQVSGTYSISAKLCYPINTAPNASLIQFLTHGVGFDKSYWDFFSASYSYQDAAALKGYTTFAYDRLGIGLSEHPDAIQIVQAPLEIAIAHSLIQMLRSGSIASTSFSKVIGVGHSLGSELTNAITAQYPKDIDAAVLTGFSIDIAGQSNFFSALNLAIARENQPSRFPLLSNGYLISNTIAGNQFAFFRAPYFDPAVLTAAEAAKQTFTIGELFTNGQFVAPAPQFKGPVDVVDGEFDLPFCQSNCLVPSNKAEAVLGALYPNAGKGSTSYIGSGAGHGLNLHYVANEVYQHIFGFIAGNGF
jgi:pimeloyl-ACP methyl ester carboxylesterase